MSIYSDEFKKSNRRLLVVFFALVVAFAFASCWMIRTVGEAVNKHGLKGIVDEVWNGTDGKPPTSENSIQEN